MPSPPERLKASTRFLPLKDHEYGDVIFTVLSGALFVVGVVLGRYDYVAVGGLFTGIGCAWILSDRVDELICERGLLWKLTLAMVVVWVFYRTSAWAGA